MKFLKMHGLGNDFVVIDETAKLTADQIKKISSRHTGAGCDQLLVIETPVNENADIFMRIYNQDGSEAQACGNGTRCVAHYWMAKNNRDKVKIQTVAGILDCTLVENDLVRVDMGVPRLGWQDIPLAEEADTLHLGIMSGQLNDPVAVNMGNPHTVFFVDQLSKVDVAGLGAQIERHVMFPERTNVEFAQVLDKNTIRTRVWERGAGVTQACGSGACATIVAAVRRGLTDRKAEVILDGGSLYMEWRPEDDHVLMTGPVSYVYEGVIFDDFDKPRSALST